MPAKTPKEVFIMLLSDARNNTERSAKVFQEFSQQAQNPDVQEALEARSFVAENALQDDRCFGESPAEMGRPANFRVNNAAAYEAGTA